MVDASVEIDAPDGEPLPLEVPDGAASTAGAMEASEAIDAGDGDVAEEALDDEDAAGDEDEL
jgi:hypothetical protein